MNKSFLLPYWCKKVGLPVLLVGLVLLVLSWCDCTLTINDIRSLIGLNEVAVDNTPLSEFSATSDLVFTLANILFIVGACMTGLSRMKCEDEYFTRLRLNALVLSVYFYAAILILGYLFCWSISFLIFSSVSFIYPMLFFLLYFHIQVAIIRRRNAHEE